MNETRPKRIRVWDLPTRLFHWALVVLVAISWISAEIGGNAMEYHMWSGYAVLTLVLFRLLWGVVGSQTARFTDFIRGPGAALRYLRQLFGRNGVAHVGHNPLGGWMIVALLVGLLVQAGTGLFANDDIMTQGPLSRKVSKDTSDWLTGIHDANFELLLTLIGIHIAAVLFYWIVKRDNLIVPMITGRRRVDPATPEPRFRSPWLALLPLAVAAGVVYWLVNKI